MAEKYTYTMSVYDPEKDETLHTVFEDTLEELMSVYSDGLGDELAEVNTIEGFVGVLNEHLGTENIEFSVGEV